MKEKELILRLEDCESEIRKINTEQGFQSERIWELEKKLKEVENAPPFCDIPKFNTLDKKTPGDFGYVNNPDMRWHKKK